jgi:putative nucleotidyltransferase with HDIG domain
MPDCDSHGAYAAAERLRSAVREALEGLPASITVSLGVATYPDHGATAEAVLHAAGQGVAAAEQLGRDRTVIYNPEIASLVLAAESRSASTDRGSNLAAVLAITEVLDIRDASTAMHSQTVGRYAETIARELGLSEELVDRIGLAGILHDVGKIAVPDGVLSKPGPLTDDEYAQMKKHPEVGALIVDGADLKDVASWVMAHHERPDGRGYPHGLSGPDIPLEARILAVADAYEAMTVDRCYRRALPVMGAREELRRCAGTQFDARVVEVFLAALERDDARLGLDELERRGSVTNL